MFHSGCGAQSVKILALSVEAWVFDVQRFWVVCLRFDDSHCLMDL